MIIITYKKLTEEVVETLLNELFTLGREQNENTIRNYMDEKKYNADMTHSDCPEPINNLTLSKTDNFGQVKSCVEKTKNKKKQTDMTKKIFGKG